MSGAGNGASGAGLPFYKLTGSGNDFVFFDARPGRPYADATARMRAPDAIEAVCDRRNGVGADGVVFLESADAVEVRIAYYNRDGSRAALCGNATLCTARLATLLGAVAADGSPFVVATDAGRIEARVRAGGDPVIDLGPVGGVVANVAEVPRRGGELAIGYATVGVPHLVVLVDSVDAVDDLEVRGAELRRPSAERPDGANVNWVSPVGDRWRMRTFERGVEAETLACGTGAVACATLIQAWTRATRPIVLVTSSGRSAEVTLSAGPDTGAALLAGEGRLVYSGRLGTR